MGPMQSLPTVKLAARRPTAPVLFLVFNRPDLTARVFERIRAARPSQLFIAADGPRSDHALDVELCEEVRRVTTNVDWPCSVKPLFQCQNLGIGKAPIVALNWFFEHVESGIILEDDFLPATSFFPFCSTLLRRYAEHAQIMSISGGNYLEGKAFPPESYYFSIYPHIWGWATWRRAWQLYDGTLEGWRVKTDQKAWLKNRIANQTEADYWFSAFNGVVDGTIRTWDYQWVYSCWQNNALAIIPRSNLISNVGFESRATNTRDENEIWSKVSTLDISFPLEHPTSIYRNEPLDRIDSDNQCYGTNFKFPGLISRGVYVDGWMGETAEVQLSGGGPSSVLRVTGLQPGHTPLRFSILVDGKPLAMRQLDPGDFGIELQVRDHGLHQVKLLADLAVPLSPPDRRVVSVLLHTIGFTEISPPAAVAKFPRDLKQLGLMSEGVHADGWMGETAEIQLSGGGPTSVLRVTGLQPGIGDRPLRFSLLVDGKPLAVRKLQRGDFEIELQVRDPGLHHVKLLADLAVPLPPPDGRVVSVLLHTIGFTEIPPPTAVTKFPGPLGASSMKARLRHFINLLGLRS
jgi:hypothetical protein